MSSGAVRFTDHPAGVSTHHIRQSHHFTFNEQPGLLSDSVTGRGSFLANTCYESEEDKVMNSRIRIVKRNETIEPKQETTNGKATEMVRNREMVAFVKDWIYEFKLRSTQERRFTLPLANTA